MLYYSKSTGGFYTTKLHGSVMPPDVVEITSSEHLKLLDEQSKGYAISTDENGQPINLPKCEQTSSERSEIELASRIITADEQIAIIKPAVEGGYAKPEHTQLLADWQRYRYELALVPEQPGWPESPQWPPQPETII